MTLDEWKERMARDQAGDFDIEAGGVIRHDKLQEEDGHYCCPIIACAVAEEDMGKYVDASNACAEFVGIGLGLDPDDVGAIMDAADGRANRSGAEGIALRDWMEEVLVHGEKAVDA